MNSDENELLTPDELAITDYLSGELKQLPAPAALVSEDRARLEELMQIRNDVSEAVIVTPEMTTTFGDVLKRAGVSGVGGQILDWMSSRWGFRLTAAAAVFLVMVAGTVAVSPNLARGPATGGMIAANSSQYYPARRELSDRHPGDNARLAHNIESATDAPAPASGEKAGLDGTVAHGNREWKSTMIRKGALGLRHEDPAAIQKRITDELEIYGGMIVNLTRNGIGEHTSISLEVSVPSEKYAKFVATVGAFGEVISQSESAQDAIGEIIDNESALAEAKDYLKRLDLLAEKTPGSLQEAQRLETERRNTRRDIERYQRALDKLKERTSMATLSISISTKRPDAAAATPPSPFQKAFKDGLEGLMNFTAFLFQVLLVTLPLSIPAVIFLILLRRRRRVPYAQ